MSSPEYAECEHFEERNSKFHNGILLLAQAYHICKAISGPSVLNFLMIPPSPPPLKLKRKPPPPQRYFKVSVTLPKKLKMLFTLHWKYLKHNFPQFKDAQQPNIQYYVITRTNLLLKCNCLTDTLIWTYCIWRT